MIQKVPRNLPAEVLSRYQGPEYTAPGEQNDVSDIEKYQEMTLRAVRRQSNFQMVTVPFDTTANLILPAAERTYFMVQNISAASLLYVGFGTEPIAGTKGFLVEAVNGWYEPFQVPQNDIWLVGNAAGNCTLIWAND